MTTLAVSMKYNDIRCKVAGSVAGVAQGFMFRLDDEILEVVTFDRVRSTTDGSMRYLGYDDHVWIVRRGQDGSIAVAHTAGITIAAVNDAATSLPGLVPPDPFPDDQGGGAAEVIAARDGYATLDARLDDIVPTGVAISALPAVVTPVGTDEFPVNQAGTTKKVTLMALWQALMAANVPALASDADLPTSVAAINAVLAAMKAVGTMAVDATYDSEFLALSPLSYWKLAEPSGTACLDATSLNPLVYQNTPTLGTAGLLAGDPDTAVTFAAASSEHAINAVPAGVTYPLGASARTIVAWIKQTTPGGYQGILTYGEAGATSTCEFYVDPTSGKLGLYNGTALIVATGPVVNDTATHMVAVAYNGTQALFSVDGSVYDAPQAVTLGTTNVAGYIMIGRDITSSFWEGIIEKVGLFDRALSEAELAALYAKGT